MAIEIFQIIFPIVAIVLAGFFYGRRHAPDMAAANQINMDLFVPALIFSVLTSKSFELQLYGDLMLIGAAIVLGSGLVVAPVARLLKYELKTLLPPMMFTNSGNMGLPLALFAFGEEALPAAVLLFIVENTLHFSVGIRMMEPRASLLSMLRIPMVLATIAGLALNFLDVVVPAVATVTIEMVGQVAIPLMLFSLGVRLIDINLEDWKMGLLGAILCPLSGVVLFLLLEPLFELPPLQYQQALLFSVMPPAVLNFMVAEKYNQEPRKVAAVVMMGNVASLLVVPIALSFML